MVFVGRKISPGDRRVRDYVYRFGPVAVSGIATTLGRDRPSVSSACLRLYRRGEIVRAYDSSERGGMFVYAAPGADLGAFG